MSLTSCEKTKTNTYELVVSVGAEEFQGAIEKAYRKNVSKICRASARAKRQRR